MKKFFLLLLCGFLCSTAFSQSRDNLAIQRAGLDYIEGFYEGDTLKLQRCLSPNLYKYGYYKDKSGQFGGSQMTYAQAIDYAKNVLAKKNFAKAGSPKEVVLLDVQSNIACVKITAWWGMDYMLLAKKGDAWIIEQIIWQGPLNTVAK